jgi:voltage-gated potassium channel
MNPTKNKIAPDNPKCTKLMEEEIEVTVSLRIKVEKLLSGQFGRVIDYISTFLALTTYVLYIINTYSHNLDFVFETADIGVMSLYAMEYILKLYASQHKGQYVVLSESLIEFLTLSPLFYIWFNNQFTNLIYHITLVFRAMRIMFKVSRFLQMAKNEVTRQFFKIIITLATLTIVVAGCIEAFDNLEREIKIKAQYEYCAEKGWAICVGKIFFFEGLDKKTGFADDLVQKTDFFRMVYFVVVTLSTVGYGDIEPISKLGQFCVLILIILATSLIPKQTSELVTLANMQSIYSRAVYKSNNDVPFL